MIATIKENIAEKLMVSPVPTIAAAIYGSWATGVQTKESDIDILVISNEINPRKHKRGKEIACIKELLSLGIPVDIMLLTTDECVSNFRNHNPLFLDIAHEGIMLLDRDDFLKNLIDETNAYIREMQIEKLVDGWRFPVSQREPTFLSGVSNKDFATAMLTDGERDFSIGIALIRGGFYDKAVYHFQQAAEKSVKAVLICFGEFKKTHFVGGILNDRLKAVELEQKWKERLSRVADISEEIEPEVTWSRYPGIDSGTLWIPSKEYTEEDALEVKEKSEEVVRIAEEFIRWWFKCCIE